MLQKNIHSLHLLFCKSRKQKFIMPKKQINSCHKTKLLSQFYKTIKKKYDTDKKIMQDRPFYFFGAKRKRKLF